MTEPSEEALRLSRQHFYMQVERSPTRRQLNELAALFQQVINERDRARYVARECAGIAQLGHERPGTPELKLIDEALSFPPQTGRL